MNDGRSEWPCLSTRGRTPALGSYTPVRDWGAGCAHGERVRHHRPEPDSTDPLGETGRSVRGGLPRRPRPRVDPPVPPRGAAGLPLRGRGGGWVFFGRDRDGGGLGGGRRGDARGGRGARGPRGGGAPG